MKKCPACAEEIQDDAKVCRYCGHKFGGRAGGKVGCAIGALAFVFFVAVIGSLGNQQSGSTGRSQTSNAQAAASLASDMASHPWAYDLEADGISGGKITSATATSIDQAYFHPPYDGGSSLQIYIRKHPRNGTDAIISVSKGQIVCDVSYGCPVNVRFDDGKARRFTGRIPSDYSHTALFLEPASTFIAEVLKSKKAVVELEFYQDGRQQFTFNTQNLHWPPKTDDIK